MDPLANELHNGHISIDSSRRGTPSPSVLRGSKCQHIRAIQLLGAGAIADVYLSLTLQGLVLM